jgi:hypothetical protein
VDITGASLANLKVEVWITVEDSSITSRVSLMMYDIWTEGTLATTTPKAPYVIIARK